MLSREELEAIRAEAESGAYPSEAAEAVLVLLWHIDAMEARRPRHEVARAAAERAYATVGEARRRRLMRDAVEKRRGA